jgi:hypothetical protein
MLSFTKESTHYLIIANIWLGVMVLSEISEVRIFAGLGAAFWIFVGWIISRREAAE